MKRKLQLYRETVRNLESQELRDAQGGNNSGVFACWPSLYRTGCCVTPGCPTQAGTSC